MGLGDWACLQIETQEVDLSWNSLSQGLPRWSCRQSMVYLMLLSPAFQEQYIGRMCQNLNFRTFQLHHCMVDFFGEQGILHWSSSSWCLQVDWSKAVKKPRFSELPCLKTTIFCSPTQRAVSRKPLAFVLFREALLSGCQIYHERFEGPIKALIIVLTLTRSKKSRIAMAWHVNLYPCNPCTS